LKISILCTIHRWGGMDVLQYGLERQTFDKNEYELILCDKLYKHRRGLMREWADENGINLIHFSPKNNSQYHVHSSVLNECLEKAQGKYSIVIGDYTYPEPHWIEIHHAYNEAGYCLSAPQKIFGLPKLSTYLEHPISVFYEPFTPEVFKIIPPFDLDPGHDLPNGTIINHLGWHNRNDSFPTEIGRQIGGYDESYNNRVGKSNLEFGLRLIHEGKQKIACDGRATIYRILSYAIPPHLEFLAPETDSSINDERYEILCKKYNIKE